MHELGLSEAIARAVLRRARGRRVTGVRVRVGAGHLLDRQALADAFRMATAGTAAEAARVDLVVEPLRVRCGGCGAEVTVDEPAMTVVCPRCGGVDLELIEGDDVMLESIALE